MGLGLCASAEIRRTGLLRRRPSQAQIWNRVREAIDSYADDGILARHRRYAEYEHTFLVFLYPSAEALEFTWGAAGRLTATVKTSTTGPGFHAYCVELLHRVAEHCGLQWDWTDGDETGFVEHRDYAALQMEMARFLPHFADALLDSDMEQASSLLLNWAIDAPAPSESAFSVTPTGTWSRDWWESVKEADDAGLLSAGREFYPWWNQARDASFYRNLGCALLWSSVAWHPPLDDEERQTCELAIDALRQAQKLDPAVPVPEAELHELTAMLNQSPEDAQPPNAEGIGFHRHPMRFSTTGKWTIVLPGYFYEQLEDDGETIAFGHGNRDVRVSSLSWSGGSGSMDDILESDWTDAPDSQVVVPILEHLKGRAAIFRLSEEGEEYWQLQGKVMGDQTLCYVTITYGDACDRQWAIDTYQSVSHPPA